MRKILVSCEHGGNDIPDGYREYFKGADAVLMSHRGWDIGALEIFKEIKADADFAIASTTSRLLVELNRSVGHPKLFSEFSEKLSEKDKTHILQHYYHPYRNQIFEWVNEWIDESLEVLHFSVHSFTPALNGQVRNADIGILYDPKRETERMWSREFRCALLKAAPDLRVRMNYPYKGIADGLTTWLRKHFPQRYMGIELEVSQAKWKALKAPVVEAFKTAKQS